MHILLRHTEGKERLFRMLKMLFRIFFIIIIMEHTDRLPVFHVFSEMFRHCAHRVAYIKCMKNQMIFGNHRSVQFPGSFQRKHSQNLKPFL